MKIILVRHGQTQWNAAKKYQGQTDIPLNEIGRKQAAAAASHLRETEQVEAIYSSDLSRTQETAEIIAKALDLEKKSDPRLREFAFGVWEGMTFSEVFEKYPEEFNNWYHNTLEFRIPGGECLNQVAARAFEALSEIIKAHTGNVVIVTHGGVIKALLHKIDESNSLWQTGVDPGSITILETSGDKMIVLEKGLTVYN